MSIKAKFRCESTVDTDHGNGFTNRIVKFRAVYGKEGENASFSKATPSGEISMQIDKSTSAYDYFKPGTEYYLTFEEGKQA